MATDPNLVEDRAARLLLNEPIGVLAPLTMKTSLSDVLYFLALAW